MNSDFIEPINPVDSALLRPQQTGASAFINSSGLDGLSGAYKTPADDLSMERFAKMLIAHVASLV
jgi:hypothetical protein